MSVIPRLPGDEPIPASAGVPCTPAAAPWVLAATILASSMAFIDGTVVNIALPALQRDLGATVFDAQWVVDGPCGPVGIRQRSSGAGSQK